MRIPGLCSILLGALFTGSVYAQTSTYTSSGTFVVPAAVTSVTIEVVGAGGSGGGNGTGGGGGGGYAKGTYSVTPGQTLTVTVGVPGAGPLAGTTSVDMLIGASGGENGTAVTSPPYLGGGGAGGMGVGGTIVNRNGGNGGGGRWTYFGGGGGGAAGSVSDGGAGGNSIDWSGVCLYPGGAAGTGGGAPGGAGGKGAGFTDGACNVTDPSGSGVNYGGGGGGGNGNGGGPGTGAGGYCVITWNAGPVCDIDTSTTLTGTTISANFPGGDAYQWIDCDDSNQPIAGATTPVFTPSVSGNYAVIITDSACVDTSACVNVIVPTCDLDTTVSVSGYTLTANQDSVDYQWINCSGGNVLAGQNNQSFTPASPGTYAVIMTTPSCTDTTVCTYVSLGMGIEGLQDAALIIYPNPFTDKFTIVGTTGDEQYMLTNTMGQVIWAGRNIDQHTFPELSKGIYVLRVQGKYSTQTFRLIKD